jgi:hypothetical protein
MCEQKKDHDLTDLTSHFNHNFKEELLATLQKLSMK